MTPRPEISTGRTGTKLDSYWCGRVFHCPCAWCKDEFENGRYLEHTRTIGGPPAPEEYCGGPISLTAPKDEFELYTRDGKCRYVRTNHRVISPVTGNVETVFLFAGFVDNIVMSNTLQNLPTQNNTERKSQ